MDPIFVELGTLPVALFLYTVLYLYYCAVLANCPTENRVRTIAGNDSRSVKIVGRISICFSCPIVSSNFQNYYLNGVNAW